MARGKKKEPLTPEERLQAALVPESDQPYKVPENWCWVYAPSMFNVEYGKGLPTKELHEDGYPVFGANGQIGFYNEYMFEDEKALMSCRGAYRGTMNLSLPKSFITNNSLVIESKFADVSVKFVFYLYSALNKTNLISGSAQPQVTVQAFNNYPVPISPLPEQQRIVDRIESLFAKLDEAKQKAQDALDSFETRKAAILHKAFTGELTAQWRKEHGVGVETWSSCKLIDILVEKPRNGYSPKPVDYVTACKSMTLSATTTGVFKPEFFKYIDEEIPEDSHLWLTPGDILIQRANSLEKVGMSAIYTGAEYEFIYPDLMMKLTVKEPNNKHYIDYYLKTDEILNYFRSNATGTAGNMPKINQKVVSETPLILPETQEQTEIVRLLDDLIAKEQQAKESAEGVLGQIDLIKKAILVRAFRGELGTNDPNEESAVELLKQIL